MAWTAPKTYIAGQVHTAAELNTYERDNLLFLHGRDVFVFTPTIEGVVAGETAYCGIHATGGGFTGTEDNVKMPSPVGCTINRLDVKTDVAPGTGEQIAVTVHKNTSPGDLTLTIAGTSQEGFDAGSMTYLEGDDISCEAVASGGMTTINLVMIALRCVPTG